MNTEKRKALAADARAYNKRIAAGPVPNTDDPLASGPIETLTGFDLDDVREQAQNVIDFAKDDPALVASATQVLSMLAVAENLAALGEIQKALAVAMDAGMKWSAILAVASWPISEGRPEASPIWACLREMPDWMTASQRMLWMRLQKRFNPQQIGMTEESFKRSLARKRSK